MSCKVTIIGAGSVGATIAYTLSGEDSQEAGVRGWVLRKG